MDCWAVRQVDVDKLYFFVGHAVAVDFLEVMQKMLGWDAARERGKR